jgi:hypothetical protein
VDRFVAVVREKMEKATIARDGAAATAETMRRLTPPKGEHGGECAMTICTNPNAKWLNRATRTYHCGECALMLNCVHFGEAQRTYHGTLCVFVPGAVGE